MSDDWTEWLDTLDALTDLDVPPGLAAISRTLLALRSVGVDGVAEAWRRQLAGAERDRFDRIWDRLPASWRVAVAAGAVGRRGVLAGG